MANTKKQTKQQNFTGTLREKVFLDRYALKNADGTLAEHTPEETWARVAWGISQNEKPQQRRKWEKAFYHVMEDFKFVPGGRILSGAGTNYQVTYFNCFVVPSPKDSRDGILESLKQLVEIQSRSGGVGLNLSSLRPRGARVKKVNGTSSGPVTWAGLFSYATHDVVQQGGCFSGDTLIMTHRGLMPIQDIVERKGNWYAATHDGYQKVTTKFNNGIKMLYEVKTKAGFSVKTTTEHRFVTVDKSGHFYLKQLADLTIGDPVVMLLGDWMEEIPYVSLNTNIPAPSKFSFGRVKMQLPTVLDEKLAFFIGAYDADGSKIKDEFSPNGKGLRISVAKNRQKDLQTLLQVIKDVLGIDAKIRNGDGAVNIVQIFSREINEFLQLNGLLKQYSVSVEVPQLIFSSPKKVVEAYIAGVFFGDGTNRGGKGGLRITTVSEKFASQLQLLLLNLGIASKVAVQDRTKQNWRTLYTVTVNGNRFMKRFAEILSPYNEKVLDHVISNRDATFNWPFNLTEKYVYLSGFQRTIARTNVATSHKAVLFLEQRIADIHEADRRDIEILASSVCDTIASITPIGEEQVYDLEVENTHLLSGNGFYTSNSRRGATMLMLWDWHPDVEEFITVKEDLSKINGANLSVCVSDAFMKAVKEDKDWDLVYPDIDDPEYDEKWNGEIDQWKALGKKVKVYKTVQARKLWDLICTAAWRSAEPGLHFMQRSNERSNTYYFERLIATNPSLRAGTRVLTKEGIFPIEKLEGKTFLVKNLDGKWSQAECFLSGKNKELYKVTLNNGREIFATAEHKWPVQLVGGGFGKITTNKLRAGNILPFPKAEDIKFESLNPLSREQGFMIGWLYGDGWISERGSSNLIQQSLFPRTSIIKGVNNIRNYSTQTSDVSFTNYLDPRIVLHDSNREQVDIKLNIRAEKKKMVFGFLFSKEDLPLADAILREVNKLKYVKSNITKASDNTYTIQSTSSEFAEHLKTIFGVDKKEKGLPISVWISGSEFIKGFIDGLISSDGFIAKNANRIIFTTKHKKIAEDISALLSFYGIKSTIRRSETQLVKFPNGKNYYKTYERYDVSIEGHNVVAFASIFTLSHPRKQANLTRIVNEYTVSRALPDHELIRIKSVEKTNIQEDVWDISVYDDTHCFYISHVVTGNCGEQPLSGWAVCNLGAMNLSAYIKDADLAKNKAGWFDYASFGKDVQIAIRFLDNVIDQTYYFFRENEKCAKEIRRTGLGIMGLGDALIKMQIPYGSKKSIPVLEKIFKTLRDHAYEASSDIAKEKGSFRKFDKKKYVKGYHIKALPKYLQQKISKQGIRNAVLLTIAPTGTTSLVSGVSSGIEPVYEFSFLRRWRGGEEIVYHPLFEEWKKTHATDEKPNYFVSANDLTPLEHVSVQAVAQEYIDSSISKTVNAPNSHTVDDVKTLYMMAYDMGLKGITYMRDGSRQGVLERVDDKKKEETKSPEQHQPILPILPVTPRPAMMQGVTYRADTPVGKTYITINHTDDKEPFEVFITIGKSGSDISAMADALGRMISINLRLNGMLSPRERMRQVVAQLSGIGGARSIGFGVNRVRSLPDAVAKVLAQHFGFAVNGRVENKKVPQKEIEAQIQTNGEKKHDFPNGQSTKASFSLSTTDIQPMQQLTIEGKSETVMASTNLYDICPECGVISFAYEEGCKKCYSCGYSEC